MGLKEKVIAKVNALGVKDAAKFYGVSVGTVSNWASGRSSPSIDAAELTIQGEVKDAPKAPSLTDWEGRKVAMLLPIYQSFHPDTHFTLFANYIRYGPSKIAFPKPIRQTCIWEARNMAIRDAMNLPGVEDFIMCDHDMILPHGDAGSYNGHYRADLPQDLAGVNAIAQIMSNPPEMGIVGALYFGRHEFGKAQCHMGFSSDSTNEELRGVTMRGPHPDRWVGTGFIKIRKWVIEKMKDAIDSGMWPECKPVDQLGKNSYYGYFNPLSVGVGEDVSFCRRAAEIGIQTYVDTSIVCLHAGERYYGPKTTRAKT